MLVLFCSWQLASRPGCASPLMGLNHSMPVHASFSKQSAMHVESLATVW